MKDSREISWSKAEEILGRRVDRRRTYALIDDSVCILYQATFPCSGCSCDSEGGCSCCRQRGAGCSECGYTGRVRDGWWDPVSPADLPKCSKGATMNDWADVIREQASA